MPPSQSTPGRGEADGFATPAQPFTGYAVDSRSGATERAGPGTAAVVMMSGQAQ
jgi:hypothetical protein